MLSTLLQAASLTLRLRSNEAQAKPFVQLRPFFSIECAQVIVRVPSIAFILP